MVDSLNSAVDLLVESNENNRIAVTVFNGSSATLLELTETGEIEDIVPDGGEYFSLSSFTGTSGADDGRAEVTCNINQRQTGTAGGTNIHAGLYEGMNILAKVPDTTFSTAKGQVVRIPNIVLMSDGAPTHRHLMLNGQTTAAFHRPAQLTVLLTYGDRTQKAVPGGTEYLMKQSVEEITIHLTVQMDLWRF